MSDLHPTPTRITLLRQVSEHRVLYVPKSGHSFLSVRNDRAKVTARISELADAGWVFRVEDGIVWRLTDAGRAVLDGAA